MGVAGLLRRMWSDRLTTGAVTIAVILALTLLAAGPTYSDAVSVAAMRRSVTDVPSGDATIAIEVRSDAEAHLELDRLASEVITNATSPVGTEVTRAIVSGSSFEVAASDRVDVVELAWLESIDRHATITEGAWPAELSATHPVDVPVDVAVDRRAADAFGLAVGDVLVLPPRSGGAPPANVTIVGVYRIDDPSEPYWRGRGRFVSGITVSQLFRTARFVTARSAMLAGLTPRTTSSWLSIPRFDRLELADIETIRRRVRALEPDLADVGARLDPDLGGGFEVDTEVPSLLAGSTRSLTVARSAVFAVVAQFALLAGYALVLVAGLTADARSAEVAMLRARGASARQLLGTALLEAAVLVVPAALIAPALASLVLRGFDEFGPLATIGLEIDPQPVAATWLAVGGAALATIALLAWPAYRSARRAEQSDHRHARQRLRAGWQRAGVDIAVLALAATAFWQLATLGDERAGSVRGRFGVDPLVIVAPTFGLLAGSLIALRAIPGLGRLAERGAATSRGVVGALSGWQLARRPTRYARAGLLVILAVAIGTFSAAYEATWTRSQTAQADHVAGADIRASPNRRTNDSITDLQLVGVHEGVDGVVRSMPVVRRDVDLPGTDRPAVLLALDADRPAVDDPALAATLVELVPPRGEPTGVELPADATSLEVEARLGHVEDQDVGTSAPTTPFRVDLVITVTDANGLMHRLDLGGVSDTAGTTTLGADLTVLRSDGVAAAPIGPLTIVELELRATPPYAPARQFAFDVGPVRATTPRGVRTVELSGSAWETSTTRFGFMVEPPSLQLVDSASRLKTMLGTGWADAPASVFFTLRAAGVSAPRALRAVATRSWLTEAELDVGDTVPVERILSEVAMVEIVAAVDAVPTIDPGVAEALVVDLATLQLAELGPGQAVADVTEHWLQVDGDDATAAVVEVTLGDAPIEATRVIVESRRRAELTSDPPALGAIGAMTLGFLAASAFAVVGFMLTTVVSARERRVEFALLRALGLSMRQLRRWMLVEQFALIASAVLFGTIVGTALAGVVLPLVSLTPTGAGVFPPVEVVIPWRTVAGLQATLVAGLLIGVVTVNALVRRIATGAMLRAGGDT